MSKYTISSECGDMHIEADSIEQAKEIYSRAMHYDFDAPPDIDSSWYWISNSETGEQLEKCGTPVSH